MANDWFQFKQFLVNQDKCAMKVGSDSVLLGAWTRIEEGAKVADLGCGTGLLALMMAQKKAKSIVAIESNYLASAQAAENFANSPWPEKFETVFANVHDLRTKLFGIFDHVIFNPPYFTNGLKSPEKNRSDARHGESSFYSWLETAYHLTHDEGSASFVIPSSDYESKFMENKELRWNVNRVCYIKGSILTDAKRVLVQVSKSNDSYHEQTLTIEKKKRHDYSEEYIKLTKDFYLHF